MKRIIVPLLAVVMLVTMVLPSGQPGDVQARMISPEEPRVSVQPVKCDADCTITLDADADNVRS